MYTEKTVTVNGHPCRVLEVGTGKPLGFIGGFFGLPRLPAVVEQLAQTHKVIVPSLPGFPGGFGHEQLDTHLDWIVAARELWVASGLENANALGVSVGGALLAELAALWTESIDKLVLLAPFGWYDPEQPPADPFAVPFNKLPSLLCANPESAQALLEPPPEADPVLWRIELIRATEAAARLLWPLGDTGLIKRLPRIVNQTLILWGRQDQLLPPSYAHTFAKHIGAQASVQLLDHAGHLAGLDQPAHMAEIVNAFLE